MLAPSMVNEVRRLLATGNFSQRRIARMTGVSRGTIAAIANGKRPDYEHRVKDDDDGYEQYEGPPQRCPLCGGMVYMPCRLCALRQCLAAQRKNSRRYAPPDRLSGPLPVEPLGLELRHDHRKRYEKVHARRILEERMGLEKVESGGAELTAH